MLFLCALVFLACSLTAQAADKLHRARISWPAVEGAGGYTVEIQNKAGESVYKQDSDSTTVYPYLVIGEYKLKITVLDAFKRPATESAWVNLSVIKTELPEFDSMNPEPLVTGNKIKAEIKGDNYMEGCSVTLSGPGGKIPGTGVSFRSSSELRCAFDLGGAAPGEYDVIIENPGGKRSSGDRKVIVISAEGKNSAKKFAIRDVSPSSFFIRGKDVTVEILGSNVSGDASVILSDSKGQFPLTVEKREGNILMVKIPAVKIVKGVYDLSLSQGGEKDTLSGAIKMKDPADGMCGLKGLYVGIGYSGMILLPKWNAILNPGLLGFGINMGHSLYGMPLLPDAQWMRHFGLELQLDGYSFTTKTKKNHYTGTLYAAPLSAGLYASVLPSDLALELLLRGDGGVAVSSLNVKGGVGSKKVISSDPFISGGASLRYTFGGLFFVEAGGNCSYFGYSGQPMTGIGFFARTGIRF